MSEKRKQYDRLIDSLYDLAINPNSFEAFHHTWEEYVEDHSNSGVFKEEHKEQLTEHFDRVFKILEKIGRQKEPPSKSIEQLVYERQVPSLVMTADTTILVSNPPTNDIFQGLDFNNKNTENVTLSSLIHADSIDTLNDGINKFLDSGSPIPLLVLLPNRMPALLLLQRIIDNNTLLIDIAGSSWDPRVEDTLTAMYDLSCRECEVASALYQGYSTNEIAAREHRSIETVRKQVKNVLNKTQTNSQPKLMRLLTSLNFAQSNSEPPLWSNPQCANYSLTLKDGRQLAYYDTGTHNSKVIIVLHGMLHDPELPELMHQQLVQNGYRIIGISRGWFGASSPPKDKENILDSNAEDLIELLDTLELENVILLGNMSGSIHALVTAALYPQRIERIINIAGMVPLTHERQINTMPNSVKRLVKTAKYFPVLLPLFIRTAIAIIDKGDIRQLFEMAYKSSPLDYALLEREDMMIRLSRGYRFASSHGYLAYTYEGIAVATDTTKYLSKLDCPVCIIHGNKDQINSTESVLDFGTTLERVHISIIEDAAHLMMYAQPKTITETLLERLNTSPVD